MSHLKNIKVQKVENILSQIGYTTSRGADIFSRSSHENHKNISNIHDLRINYRNRVCFSLIFEAITIIWLHIIVIVTCICNLP